MPNGSYVTNIFDSLARMTGTSLKNSAHAVLNSHSYLHDDANQRTRQTQTDGSRVDYTYDNIGQVRSAVGRELDGTLRLHENYGYAYDLAGNLMYRTNNAMVETFSVNAINQITLIDAANSLTVAGATTTAATNVTVNGVTATLYTDNTFARQNVSWQDGNNVFTAVARDALGNSDTNVIRHYYPGYNCRGYDANGNLLSAWTTDYGYDAENRLWTVSRWDWGTINYLGKTEFLYDGFHRLRLRREYNENNSVTGET
jgi:hypothetical protein